MSFDGSSREPTMTHATSDEPPAVVLSGYLYKKTRDGRWQRRWFETNGFYLTYYKSKKMEKLLAALSLPQVGEVTLVENGGEGNEGLFSIELNSRIYTLRSKDKEEAEKWVDGLKRLRDQGALASARLSGPDVTRLQSFQVESGKAKPMSSETNASATWVKGQKFLCTWCPCS